ncbi:S8 family peptidase [Sphingobium sp. CR28]|uniref:S8 family peptidase n=1 Tax=Sphingobium sp. CR28 TaxID=3400272 RepID=UPI003FF095B5
MRLTASSGMMVIALTLAGCGGGGGVSSTPAPSPGQSPSPTPSPTPSPPAASTINYNTAEYQRSSASYHGAIAAYQAGASGAGIMVGVVDSGVSDPNGELGARLSPLSRDFAGNSSASDESGHGTAVAQVIAGARNNQLSMGMAWGASVLGLRADTPGSCSTKTTENTSGCTFASSAMASAVDYARQQGARVINMSLGGGAAGGSLAQAVSRATAAGIIIVISAGNDKEAAPDALARSLAAPNVSRGLVIIATSVDNKDAHSSFANGAQGYEQTTISALGERVLSFDHTGAQLLYSGTSFAAPQIAGAVALIAQAFPNLTPAEVVQLILTTARDAGASGPDAVFGRGILDLARTFQPVGSSSLAGSAVPVSTSDTSTLSSAMGDASSATGQALGAVMLDGYGRAFGIDLGSSLRVRTARPALGPAFGMRTRQVAGGNGALSITASIAPGRNGQITTQALDLTRADAATAQLLSARIVAALGPDTRFALGISRDTGALLQTGTDGSSVVPFLVAGEALGDLGQDLRADAQLSVSHRLSSALTLHGAMTTGAASRWDRRGRVTDSATLRPARYQSAEVGIIAVAGPLLASLAGEMVNEEGSLLGARLAPAFGGQSARSMFAEVRLAIEPIEGFTLSGGWRRGWTRAAAGGALINGGLLKSESWSADASLRNVLAIGDVGGLRFSAPLRVTHSRFDLTLPVAYDWQSGLVETRTSRLDLSPTGRERNAELVYGLSLAGGWIDGHLYWRRDAGNIAVMPDDFGSALRWTVGF